MAGEKFADADLIGIPLRLCLVIKQLAQQSLRLSLRSSTEALMIPIQSLPQELKKLISKVVKKSKETSFTPFFSLKKR